MTNYLQKEALKPLLKCQSVMELNILFSVSSSKESIEMIFKWRVKRPSISNILSNTVNPITAAFFKNIILNK